MLYVIAKVVSIFVILAGPAIWRRTQQVATVWDARARVWCMTVCGNKYFIALARHTCATLSRQKRQLKFYHLLGTRVCHAFTHSHTHKPTTNNNDTAAADDDVHNNKLYWMRPRTHTRASATHWCMRLIKYKCESVYCVSEYDVCVSACARASELGLIPVFTTDTLDEPIEFIEVTIVCKSPWN